jgi:hypothetical protein
VISDGYQTLEQSNITVPNIVTLIESLTPSSTEVTGQLLDSFGNPVEFGNINVQDSEGNLMGSSVTAEDGSFAISTAYGTNLNVVAFALGAAPVTNFVTSLQSGTNDIGSIVVSELAIAGAVSMPATNLPSAGNQSEVDNGNALPSVEVGNPPPDYEPYIDDTRYYNDLIEYYQLYDLVSVEVLNPVFYENGTKVAPQPCGCADVDAANAALWLSVQTARQQVDSDRDNFVNNLNSYGMNLTTVAAQINVADAAIGPFLSDASVFGVDALIVSLAGWVFKAWGAPEAICDAGKLGASIANDIQKTIITKEPPTPIGIIGNLKDALFTLRTQNPSFQLAKKFDKKFPFVGQFIQFADSTWNDSVVLYNADVNLNAQFSTAEQSGKIAETAKTTLELDWVSMMLLDSKPYQTCAANCNPNPINPNPPCITCYTNPVPPPNPSDPNAKMGPVGFGPLHYMAGNSVLPYIIEFENATNATAPAQHVSISDFLSTNLDWNTFQLGEIGFGSQYVPIPPGSDYFETNFVITYNGVNIEVQIDAGIDYATGEVFADLYSLDPVTQLPPAVNIGLLPPEDGTGRGSGYFSYYVTANTNLATGTQITNIAYVQFDENPLVATDQVNDEDPSQGVDTNKMAIVTIDNSNPYSSVRTLPYVSINATFTLCWSGTDTGSGIVAYDVYVSTSNGPWSVWLAGTTNTCASFQGQIGKSYGFYSIAYDGAGNAQPTPTNANAAIIIAPHLPPQLNPVPSQVSAVGQYLLITNTAQDPDLPITFSLGVGAPAGASIKTNGIFSWAPSCAQASTTNLITIWATDHYSIPLSSSVSFVVIVSECLQVGVGSTVMQVGTTSSVPVSVISTLGLTNLSFAVAYPTNRFTNWVMNSSNNAIGATLVQSLDPSQTLFSLAASNGHTIAGPALLGSLSFEALPGASAFVPLTPVNVLGTKTDGSAVGNSGGQAGRVVVIGREPLLEAWLGTNSARMLTLFGNLGASYQIAFNTNVLSANWQNGWQTPMTNLYEYFGVDPTAPRLFYRAWEFLAAPPP